MSDSGRKNTVLVVDDSPENIDLLGDVLKQDYEIKVALNGERALKIAGSENPPDIILKLIQNLGKWLGHYFRLTRLHVLFAFFYGYLAHSFLSPLDNYLFLKFPSSSHHVLPIIPVPANMSPPPPESPVLAWYHLILQLTAPILRVQA